MGALRAIIASVVLCAFAAAPAQSQWIVDSPVQDANAIRQIVQAVQQVQQTIQLVQSARQELQQLPQSFLGTNIPGRIQAVSAVLQAAQAACMSARRAQVPVAACQVQANVATVQAQSLGASMASLQGIQNAARGSTGGLQAAQTSAHGIIEVATQLQQLHQLSIADATQKAIDGQITTQATTKAGVVNPW